MFEEKTNTSETLLSPSDSILWATNCRTPKGAVFCAFSPPNGDDNEILTVAGRSFGAPVIGLRACLPRSSANFAPNCAGDHSQRTWQSQSPGRREETVGFFGAPRDGLDASIRCRAWIRKRSAPTGASMNPEGNKSRGHRQRIHPGRARRDRRPVRANGSGPMPSPPASLAKAHIRSTDGAGRRGSKRFQSGAKETFASEQASWTDKIPTLGRIKLFISAVWETIHPSRRGANGKSSNQHNA